MKFQLINGLKKKKNNITGRGLMVVLIMSLFVTMHVGAVKSTGDLRSEFEKEIGNIIAGKPASFSDGKVTYYVPTAWDNANVRQKLAKTASDKSFEGEQFFLNAVSPETREDTRNVEVFNIFYFVNKTYLKEPPSKPGNSYIKKVEKEIVKNITGSDEKISIQEIKKISDLSSPKVPVHYCNTTYETADHISYRLEFFFRPDNEGITCMLYLYYPGAKSHPHVKDAAFLMKTMKIQSE